jgi:hypothetical protein
MNFFKKLFSGNNTPPPSPIAQPLDESQYWNIIAESLAKSDTQEDQEEYLVKQLEVLSPADMVGFRLQTDKLLHDTYNEQMWCAGYIINGGCSDDMFEYFRCWVISRGKDVYYAAKANPDTLITQVSPEMEMYDFEDFWHVALKAFEAKTGKDLYDFIDNDNVAFGEGYYPEITFTWEEENPESMRAICPKLFDAMWQ